MKLLGGVNIGIIVWGLVRMAMAHDQTEIMAQLMAVDKKDGNPGRDSN